MQEKYLLLIGKWEDVTQELGEFISVEDLEKFVADKNKMHFAKQYMVYECKLIKSLSKTTDSK